jgi:hypothetical protein
MASQRKSRPKKDNRQPATAKNPAEQPGLQQLDWDTIRNAEFVPDSVPENGDIRYRDNDNQGLMEAPEEEDDNALQESDEALPDEEEERAIRERNRSSQ